MDLSKQIERLLWTRKDWVPSSEICATFGLPDDRVLRQDGALPGLCTTFAISHSKKGLRHVRFATTTEWLKFKKRLVKHSVAQFRRISGLGHVRHNATYTLEDLQVESDTGQVVMNL